MARKRKVREDPTFILRNIIDKRIEEKKKLKHNANYRKPSRTKKEIPLEKILKSAEPTEMPSKTINEIKEPENEEESAKSDIKDAMEHILKTAPTKAETKHAGTKEKKEDFDIEDTLKHILNATAPSKKLKSKPRANIKGTIKSTAAPAGHKATDIKEHAAKKEEKGLTPEHLLKLKKARKEFMKQGKYKEMKKKVSEEVKEVEEKVGKEVEAIKAKEVTVLEKKVTAIKKPENVKKELKIESKKQEFIKTGVEGLDSLFEEGRGIPKGTSVLIVGGPGTGKTLFCLHMLNYAVNKGEKCLYLSFEESTERLKQHMRDFGWDPDRLEKKGLLVIKRIDPYEISRSIEALLAQARGELLIEVEGISSFIPKDFKPDRIILDSVTALTAAFASSDSSYRSYIEQSFLFMEKLGATSFLISETEDAPKKLSPSGIEEFLADGVIILYNIRNEGVRERAVEIFKMRGSKFQEKIVAYQITDTGVVVYPQQQVFGALNM